MSHMVVLAFVSSSDSQYYKGGVFKVNCNITVFEGKLRLILLFKFWMERRPAFHENMFSFHIDIWRHNYAFSREFGKMSQIRIFRGVCQDLLI